jgi:lipid-A-disaccharide synthase
MKPPTFMLVAGEPSGDANGAALVRALAAARPAARFIGAGGPQMAEAGLASSFDLTADAVIGLSAVIRKLPRFRRRLRELARLAAAERPDVIILIDFEFFNRCLARALRALAWHGAAPAWRPRIVKYVSPQVWASRPGRAEKLARDIDLLLCLFPFEKEWYARRLSRLLVECVGHPMFDRSPPAAGGPEKPDAIPTIVLLPGSRRGELQRHLPVMLGAAALIAARQPAQFKLVAPNEDMAALARAAAAAGAARVEIQTGHLEEALARATLAIASTGTVTLECARCGVPAVALYKTSLLTYLIARQIVTVNFLALPNLLAGEALYPEFIQGRATARNIAQAALELLSNPDRRGEVRAKLRQIISALGGPGAAARAAAAILDLTDTANPS